MMFKEYTDIFADIIILAIVNFVCAEKFFLSNLLDREI